MRGYGDNPVYHAIISTHMISEDIKSEYLFEGFFFNSDDFVRASAFINGHSPQYAFSVSNVLNIWF